MSPVHKFVQKYASEEQSHRQVLDNMGPVFGNEEITGDCCERNQNPFEPGIFWGAL
jgi:hypothetical protein